MISELEGKPGLWVKGFFLKLYLRSHPRFLALPMVPYLSFFATRPSTSFALILFVVSGFLDGFTQHGGNKGRFNSQRGR